jgi:myosin XVIII
MPQFYVGKTSTVFSPHSILPIFGLDSLNIHYISFAFLSPLQSVQLDLEMRGERLAALTKELDEMTTEGRSDADTTALRRAKHELEMKVKDQVRISQTCHRVQCSAADVCVISQEEELDELAGQVQLLESARLRLEMAMEQMRKENKKELAQREEEMEDTRCSAQKKVKGLCQRGLPPSQCWTLLTCDLLVFPF